MRYLALACDYDGTLARLGQVDEATRTALQRVRASGRKTILVTGREKEDLQTVCPAFELFDVIVAENGALVFRPSSPEEKVLGKPPPEKFLQFLRERGVQPLSIGRVIVATRDPYDKVVLEAIHALGLELQVIFNKGAVMVLPAGINKAAGLAVALKELELSPHNVVGVGDAENDHSFLASCECAVAVANALPMLKEGADFTTAHSHGGGVVELIDELIADDLRERDPQLRRHHLLLGTRDDGSEVRIRPYAGNLLIAGPSGSGKSTTATAFLERLVEQKYQFCVIDPEGDFETFEGAVPLGNPQQAPGMNEVLQLLKSPKTNAVVSLLGLPLADRPPFFMALLQHLQEMRARFGRPHWLIIDEAHHLLPTVWQPASLTLPQTLDRMVLITVHPKEVSPAILSSVSTVIAVGQAPEKTLGEFSATLGESPPAVPSTALSSGEVLIWSRSAGKPPFRLHIEPARSERRRHSRKYAEGELPPDNSFYFRGPEGKLNLRAQNLILFVQLAEGVDDETWTYHLRRGDYSHWFREMIKDDGLAEEAARVEQMTNLSPAESRARIKELIGKHYTLPASSPGANVPERHSDPMGSKK